MEIENTYVLNPEYLLRPDKNRVFITNRGEDPRISDFLGFVHPVYAILLSLFDGEKPLAEIIANAASFMKREPDVITNIVTPLLENEKDLYFEYDGYQFSFPAQVLVKKKEGVVYEKLDPASFFIPKKDLDMDSWRLNTPFSTLFMINTRCVTDCIYCYADRGRKMDCQIPLERLKELIHEAKALKIRSFDITGGEFFLYPHWEELLTELLAHGFQPYISTKCPLDEITIDKIKALGLKRIQISIDSLVKEELMHILRVPAGYPEQLIETLKHLDEKGMEIFTNSQVTSINQESITGLIDFLLTLKNIKRINVGAAGFSLYRSEADFHEYKASLDAIEKIKNRIEELKKQYGDKISINFAGYSDKSGFIGPTPEEKKKNFNQRARCSGNFYAFIILPDGKVTVCEELYWHPKFIIGDLTHQSITEVWNSPQALELYHMSRDMIREESECKNCADFDPCHKNKGVCWKEVLYAYGMENWDFPDPRCPAARLPFREYYLS